MCPPEKCLLNSKSSASNLTPNIPGRYNPDVSGCEGVVRASKGYVHRIVFPWKSLMIDVAVHVSLSVAEKRDAEYSI